VARNSAESGEETGGFSDGGGDEGAAKGDGLVNEDGLGTNQNPKS
jgi:hypothetical protein